MNHSTVNQRKKSLTVLASVAMPGLGHIYNGELVKGLCFFALFILTPLIFLRITSMLPNGLLLPGAIFTSLAAIIVYALIVISAVQLVKKHTDVYQTKAYNHWYFYILLWGIFVLLIGGTALTYSQNHILQFCRIETGSMEPALMRGDFVIVDRKNKVSPAIGDIILFTYPDDRSKLYIKRIAALPGDTVSLQDKTQLKVPHGEVFVLGDNRSHAVDSRTFGTIPLRDIYGKARIVYFSMNHGIRWNRIGLKL